MSTTRNLRKHPLDFPGSQAARVTRDYGAHWPKGTIVEIVNDAGGYSGFIGKPYYVWPIWHVPAGHGGVLDDGDLAPIGPVARMLLRKRR